MTDQNNVELMRSHDNHAGFEVSVVIPCLNEASSIGACIDSALSAFATLNITGEVVVVDNGSTDGSVDIAGAHGARVVHATVKGYGSALRKGIEQARGEFIILGDANGSHDFGEIDRFIAKWGRRLQLRHREPSSF